MSSSSTFRFEVALSFPGEHRGRVRAIAQILADSLGQEKVLYDKWYDAEFARPNLDVYLPDLYQQARLLVFFFCQDYVRKTWCGLEWRAGRALLKFGEDTRLMILRLDDSAIGGLLPIDGYLDIREMPNEEVAEKILKRLARYVPPGPRGTDEIVRDLRVCALADIQNRCGTVRVLTMEQPVDLGSVYTDVNILEKRTANLRKTLDELVKDPNPETVNRFGISATAIKRIPGLKAFDAHLRVIIYGKPGAGKTTFLKWLAMRCAHGNFRGELVPAFVTLRDFAEAAGTPELGVYVQRQLGGGADCQAALKAGRVLVLLDGLDEVRDQEFTRVRKSIEAFTTEFPSCTIAITCRIATREYVFERFTEVEMADFNRDQIARFTTAWFRVQGSEKTAERFKEKLEANPPLLELASSPLLLTLLCLVFQERNEFDGTRAELYKEGVDVLLRKWDSKRGIERDRPYGLRIADMETLLSEIAYRRFLASEYFFDQSSLEKQIREFFAERNQLKPGEELIEERVLNSIESHLGLMVQRAVRAYSFSHLTFQEYFAACRVEKKRTLLAEIGPSVGDPRWREFWLLLAAMINADDIIPELKKRTDILVKGESEIDRFLDWCRRKAAAQGGAYKKHRLRAFYFGLSTPGLDLYRAIARTHDNDLALVLDFSLTRLNNDLARDRDLRPTGDLDLALNNATAVTPALAEILTDLRAELSTVDPAWWSKHRSAWRERLRAAAIRHRDVGHEWRFTERQRKLLDDYNRANLLLVESMKAARGLTNKTRQYIEDTMLLPWDQIPPRES